MKKLLVKNRIWIIAGLVLCVLSCLPYFILGEDSIVTYHDQLDGEILTYIFNAKYMFKPVSVYPELMNGIGKGGLAMPAPIFVIFYKLFKPFVAYVVSTIVIKMVGFTGTYLLIRELTRRKWLGFVCGIAFMLAPFYTVYGLCVPGQPLLMWSIICLRDPKKKPFLYWAMIAVYALGSSMALVGFTWIIFLGAALLIALIRKKNVVRYLVALLVCTGVYLAENIELVKQLFGGSSFVSHKSEIVRNASPFFSTLWDAFGNGVDYTEMGQKFYIPAIILSLAFVGLFRFAYKNKSKKVDSEVKYLIVGIGMNALLALFYALYSSEPVVNLCNSVSGPLHDFNFGRVVWIMPVVWISMLGLSLSILWDLFVSIFEKGRTSFLAKMVRWLIWVVYLAASLATVGLLAVNGFLRSDLKYNVKKLFDRDYYMMTWEQFFAEDLFAEVDRVIGLNKEDYRVVSLGIYPSAAAYNGFYCLDAYSNNYDVEYKHEFRKVIAAELGKSDYLRTWYDDWGNRCYIVLAESSNYFTFEKRWIPATEECDINLEQLRDMGCHYMISASYIFDAEDMGMTLLNEDPILTEDSWYRLWVYEF